VPGIPVFGADQLADVAADLQSDRGHLSTSAVPAQATTALGAARTSPAASVEADPVLATRHATPNQIVRQGAVRAVEVAAAGGHHLLLMGLPGAGCAYYARLLHSMLPPLTQNQALEVAAIRSVAGDLAHGAPLMTTAPFVTPHCSTSLPAFVGGGSGLAEPGALSRAHHGVLFLDDVGDFPPNMPEVVRSSLEVREVRLARRDGVARYPAGFQLVLATTPCPCQRPEPDCVCTPHARRRFLARIAGPLLDRIDLRVRLHTPDTSIVHEPLPETDSGQRTRVHEARIRAGQRWSTYRGSTNADVPAAAFTHAEFRLHRKVTAPLDRALEIGALSGRGGVRTLRVAWTLADLAGLIRPGCDEIVEALEFRDRQSS
jgi:magnesium chelatase family protein